MTSNPPRKRGRPPNEPTPMSNHADMDVSTLKDIKLAIIEQLKGDKFSSFFSTLSADALVSLAAELAYEVAAYTAVAGLVSDSAKYYPPLQVLFYEMWRVGMVQSPVNPVMISRSGPKPRADHYAFAATVRDRLAEAGVRLRQWDNNRTRVDDLQAFLAALLKTHGITGVHISDRTFDQLPEQGFTDKVN